MTQYRLFSINQSKYRNSESILKTKSFVIIFNFTVFLGFLLLNREVTCLKYPLTTGSLKLWSVHHQGSYKWAVHVQMYTRVYIQMNTRVYIQMYTRVYIQMNSLCDDFLTYNIVYQGAMVFCFDNIFYHSLRWSEGDNIDHEWHGCYKYQWICLVDSQNSNITMDKYWCHFGDVCHVR